MGCNNNYEKNLIKPIYKRSKKENKNDPYVIPKKYRKNISNYGYLKN